MRTRSLILTTLFTIALMGPSCATEPDPESGDAPPVEQLEQALSAPITPDVAVPIPEFYRAGDIALAAYAQPLFSFGCGGAMIGPNLYMTAAHCAHDEEAFVGFFGYREQDVTQKNIEWFACDLLINTFSDTDLVLYYCGPNGAGDHPGDKYGYLDFDVSEPAVGAEVYAVWHNPIDTIGGWHQIYSKGEVTSNTTFGWYTPNGWSSGFSTDTYCCGGASGSPQLNPTSHRIEIGPTSTGLNCGALRNALSMRDYLFHAHVENGKVYTKVQDLGLNPNDYLGFIDKDLNWLIDIQEDLEQLSGENRRDYYTFQLRSERQNALWTPSSFTTIYSTYGWARFNRPAPASGWASALSHDKLNLAGGTHYRVRFQTWTSSPGSVLLVGLYNSSGSLVAGAISQTDWQQLWETHVVTVYAPSDDLELRLMVYQDGRIYYRDVVVARVENNAFTVDFDSHDQRQRWWDSHHGRSSVILPDGNSASNLINFAGLVWHLSSSLGTRWTLGNRLVPLQKNHTYEICFDVRNAPNDPFQAPGEALMEVRSNGGLVVQQYYTPTTNWATVCTPSFTMPHSDSLLRFGTRDADLPIDLDLGAYLVDNIVVTRL